MPGIGEPSRHLFQLQRQRFMLFLCAAWIAGTIVAAAAVKDTECGPTVTFFPAGSEDQNRPFAWGRTAQMAAGNFAPDVMFTIAMPSLVNIPGSSALSKPVLQIQPLHDLFVVGNSNISRECMGYGPHRRRQLLETHSSTSADNSRSADSSHGASRAATTASSSRQLKALLSNDSNIDSPDQQQKDAGKEKILVVPPEESDKQQQEDQKEPQLALLYPARFQVQYRINGSADVDLGQFNNVNEPAKIVLELADYDDGYYCLEVSVTILPWTGLLMPGSVAVPVKPLTTTKQVCFYKMDGFPTAEASFSTCSSEQFSVNISGISPAPMPLYPGSDEPLLYPVVRFSSELNRTGDFHWPPSDVKTSMEHWIIAANTSTAFMWTPEDHLYEGWYNVHLDVSLTTAFPTLMAVGLDNVTTYNETKAPEVLKGWYKYLSKQQYPTGTVFGVQHQLSRYRNMEGPMEIDIPLNVEVPFTWEFDGFGNTFCYVDGRLKHNWGDDECMPPFNVLLQNRRNHTLKVVRKDVCGNNLTVVSTYGSWGYAVTQIPKDPLEELALAAANQMYDGSGAVLEMAPLQGTSLRRNVPYRAAGSSGGLLEGGGVTGRLAWWCALLVLLVLQQLLS